MKIGFNLLLWTTHVTQEHLPLFDKLKKAGYDGLEIPIFEGEPEYYSQLKTKLDNAGLSSTSLGLCGETNINPISSNIEDRNRASDHLKWLVDCSEALGSEVLVGPFHSPLAEFSGEGTTQDEWNRGIEIHREMADYAANTGLQVSLEPLNRFECYFLNTAQDTSRYVREVNRKNFGMLFDTFHSNIEEKDTALAIKHSANEINHFHVSENDRGVPGQGHIDFNTILKSLKATGYDGWITVEAFGRALPDLAAATKIWRSLFENEEEVYNGAYKVISDNWT